MQAHPDDLAAGLTAGAAFTLRAGADDALVKTSMDRARNAEVGLTPLLTAGPRPIWAGAMDAIAAAARQFYDLPVAIERQIESIVEIEVRLTFSHMWQPMCSVDEAVQQIHMTISALCRAAVSETPTI
jgi:hypothetical protein